ncbi:DNA topoisomerase 2 [Tanacetum coccineum]
MGKKLKKVRISENWCMVSFKPDLAQFGMECLEHDIVALMKRRVVDLAGCCSGVKVQLDGTHVLPRTFEDYVELYLQASGTYPTRIYEKLNDRCEICVAIADLVFEHFDQVSFVNNIPTVEGGYITSQITDYLATIFNLEPNVIESYLWVFVNAHIHNPAFDSQTKEELTFESTCELTPEFLKKIADSLKDLDSLQDFFEKSNARKLNIQDAKLANTPYSQQCTLILTEGDFATDFVMSRLGQDKDKYGVLPLEGNLLNVREASPQELEKNTDIQNIKKILGLQDGKIYENVKELRYGHLMIMANEDHYGSRIKGLLINFLHYFWPSLLKVKNFMQWFILPIVKASHKRTNKVFLFYTMSEYEAMRKQLGNQFTITSYKEIESEEGGKYNYDQHIKDYVWDNDEDGDVEIESEEGGKYNYDQHIKDFVWDNDEDGDAIERAFSNKKIEERKHWLQAPQVVKSMGKKLKKVRISENWCMVSFKPDLAQFGMECLEHDIVALMKRRVVDLAGCCSGVKVQLDGTHVLPRTFEDYVELYLQASGTYPTRIYEKLNDRCEICVAIADLVFEHFDQVSFVNNIPMVEGGYITSQITDYLATIFNLEPNVIESYLWVFVNAHIHNPAFDSQTKEELTFESTCELTLEFLGLLIENRLSVLKMNNQIISDYNVM